MRRLNKRMRMTRLPTRRSTEKKKKDNFVGDRLLLHFNEKESLIYYVSASDYSMKREDKRRIFQE